jgi:hypothetical protein
MSGERERDESKILWKNVGGGSFYLRGKVRIVSGEEFMASEEEIPKGARDIIKRVDHLPQPVPGDEEEIVEDNESGDPDGTGDGDGNDEEE